MKIKLSMSILIGCMFILSACSIQQEYFQNELSIGDIYQNKKKTLYEAIPVDLTNTKIEYNNLGKIWTEQNTAIALDMGQFLFSGEDHSKVCSAGCGGDYWFKHSINEGAGDICENRRIILPEYGIKIFSWGWAGKQIPQKEEIISNNSIILNILDWQNKNETISVYKIPNGQNFKQTLEKTRPDIKNMKKYEKKQIHGNNGDIYTWYDGFGKNINNTNSENIEIYKVSNDKSGEDKLFFWYKEQPNIFFYLGGL